MPTLLAALVLSCSAFMHEGDNGPLVAKSYDWSMEHGLAIVNPRGIMKRALTLSPDERAATWTSRYASITLNQYGRELPNSGMNEKGLVVEVLMLPVSDFPDPDARPAVTEVGFVQYLLDNAATVDEAATLAEQVRISKAYAKIHYFVCDATAACAAFELLDKLLVVTKSDAMPVCAITNSRYDESKASLDRTKPSASSLGRFKRLAVAKKARTVNEAFGLLDEVRFADSTQWQVVYEPKTLTAHFRTLKHPSIKTVRLGAFDLDCKAGARVMSMQSDVSDRFVPYSEAAQRSLVTTTLAPLQKHLPKGIVDVVSRFPSTFACAL